MTDSPTVYFTDEESSDESVSDVVKESTPTQRRRAREIARSDGGPKLGDLFNYLCTSFDHQIDPSVDDLVELIFNCSGATTTFFTEEELQSEAPSTILDNLCVRAEQAGISISNVSPLQASLLRELSHVRNAQLEELYKQDNLFQTHGLSRLNDDPQTGSSFKSFVKLHDKINKDDLDLYKLCTSSKFRKYARLRENLSEFIVKYFQSVHPSELITRKLPPIQEWILALTESKVRPVRLSGVFFTARLGVALTKRLDNLRRDFQICVEAYGTDKTTDKKRLTQIKDILRTVNHLIRFLQDLLIPILKNRVNDVSWIIQYEAVDGMSQIVQALPIQTLLGNDRSYLDDFWKTACQHEVSELRLFAIHLVLPLFTSLSDALKGSTKQDRAFDFVVPDRVLMADTAINGLVQKLDTRVPQLPDHTSRLSQTLEQFFLTILKHVQDSDLRVALMAADRLSVMSRFDTEFSVAYDVSLSDASITPAVALLVHLDCPLVRHEIAKFVNKALFTHNIINETAVRAILTGEEEALDRSKVMDQSIELRTFISFFKEYASGPMWQSRNVNTIKAFWPLAPVLHQWDLLIDHLNIAFGAKPVMQIEGRELLDILGDQLWVDEESSGALLTLMLGTLECQRMVLCGKERYSAPPRFEPYMLDRVAKLDAERVLAELVQGGFRLSGGQDDCLWDFAQAGVENRPFMRRVTRNIMSMWRCLSQLIVGSRATPKYLLMALSIAYELVDATTGLAHHLAIVRSDINFSDLILVSRSLNEICQTLIRSQRDRAVLKSAFAILRKLRNQASQLDQIQFGISDNPLETWLKYLTEQQKNIDQFLDVMRKNVLELISGRVREILAEKDINHVRESMATLRGHLNLIATLAENDTTNTFRHGLDTVDDLVTLVEQKQTYLQQSARSELEPGNLITVLTFDVLWLALAQWYEQIDQRFGSFILHDIRCFIGKPLCPVDTMDQTRGVKMEERLKLFKEDMDVFKEFQAQILGFAASCCAAFRARVLTEAEGVDDAARKSDLVCAMACASFIVNASHLHTTSGLWIKIEREMLGLLRDPMVTTLNEDVVARVNDIVTLCHECRGGASGHEVAVFADELRLVSRCHRPTAIAALEEDFPLPALTLGLWPFNDETPDSTPAPYKHCNIHQLYRCAQSDEALEALCQTLPTIPELAYTFHVQLMASICQLADADFWRNGMLGPVILHGLSSKSFVSQAMGLSFLQRLRSYEKARITEINLLAQQMGADSISFLTQAVQPMILIELLLATVIAAVDNYVRTRKNTDPITPAANLTNAEKICSRAAALLHPSYFVEMSDRLFEVFIMQVLEFIVPERPVEAHIYFLRAVWKHLLNGKIKRRWKREECHSSAERAVTLSVQKLQKIGPAEKKLRHQLEIETRKFVATCHPGIKVPRLMHDAPSPGLARRKRKDSSASDSQSDSLDDILTSSSAPE